MTRTARALALALVAAAGCGGDGATGDATDAGPDGDALPDATAGTVDLVVAQGHMGRTLVSCDRGATWTADRSDDDAVRCFTGGVDCDHSPGAGRGLDGAAGRIWATFGWGQPGGIRTSTDGVTWTTALADTTFGGVVALPDGATVIAAGHSPMRSTDGGATWAAAGDPGLTVWNVRRAAYVPTAGGRVLMFGNDGEVRELVVSADGGATWSHASWPAACGVGDLQSSGGIVGTADRIVVVAGHTACTSTDGGATFTEAEVGGDVRGQVVWTGAEVWAWGAGVAWHSPDGVSWTEVPLAPAGLDLGAVTYAAGRFVGVRGGWQVWYQDQRFYGSDDGVTWAEAVAPGGHPIRFMSYVPGAVDTACR
ncbi:MAG: sialidase family protein [Kofleriaceae bacterium]